METAVETLAAISLLAIGLSHIIQPRVWVEFFVMLREKGKVGSILAGLLHFPLAVIIVAFHNIWHEGRTGIPACPSDVDSLLRAWTAFLPVPLTWTVC
jgi:hypothetical protein